MDDLTIRLRTWDDQQPPFGIMNEAATEIDRLRQIIANYVVVEHDHREAWNQQIEPKTGIDVLRAREQDLFDEAYRIMGAAVDDYHQP